MERPNRVCVTELLRMLAAGSVICSLAACHSHPRPTDAPAATVSKADSPAKPRSALHNVHKINDRLFSGAQPEGNAAFEELKARGFRTIVSVDGATPDVASAASHALRYVHIPVTYATVTDEQRLELARVIRDLPGPIYVHCHHGKHRGPAAAAAAAITLGMMTNAEGTEFIRQAGTAPNYTGLYECVAEASVASKEDLDRVPDYFPSVKKAQGVTAAMVEIDVAFDNLTAIKAAGWHTPKDHPDLVPAAEAGRVTDNFRIAHEDSAYPTGAHLPEEFSRRVLDAVEQASTLEEGIVANAQVAKLDAAYTTLQKSCKECHAKYRDVVR